MRKIVRKKWMSYKKLIFCFSTTTFIICGILGVLLPNSAKADTPTFTMSSDTKFFVITNYTSVSGYTSAIDNLAATDGLKGIFPISDSKISLPYNINNALPTYGGTDKPAWQDAATLYAAIHTYYLNLKIASNSAYMTQAQVNVNSISSIAGASPNTGGSPGGSSGGGSGGSGAGSGSGSGGSGGSAGSGSGAAGGATANAGCGSNQPDAKNFGFTYINLIKTESIRQTLSGSTDAATQIQKIWKALLTVVNTLIIAVLILVAFAEMLRININTYGIKKILPTMILAIIAANFSYMFCRLIIDIANVSMTFINAITSNKVTATIVALPAFCWNSQAATIWSNIFTSSLIGNILLAVEGVILLCLAFLFIVRNWILYMMVILSPVAIMALVLPQTKKWFNQWWTTLIQWTFMPLVSYIFIAIAVVFQGALGGSSSIMYTVFACFCYYEAITLPFKLGGPAMQSFYKMTGAKYLTGQARDTAVNNIKRYAGGTWDTVKAKGLQNELLAPLVGGLGEKLQYRADRAARNLKASKDVAQSREAKKRGDKGAIEEANFQAMEGSTKWEEAMALGRVSEEGNPLHGKLMQIRGKSNKAILEMEDAERSFKMMEDDIQKILKTAGLNPDAPATQAAIEALASQLGFNAKEVEATTNFMTIYGQNLAASTIHDEEAKKAHNDLIKASAQAMKSLDDLAGSFQTTEEQSDKLSEFLAKNTGNLSNAATYSAAAQNLRENHNIDAANLDEGGLEAAMNANLGKNIEARKLLQTAADSAASGDTGAWTSAVEALQKDHGMDISSLSETEIRARRAEIITEGDSMAGEFNTLLHNYSQKSTVDEAARSLLSLGVDVVGNYDEASLTKIKKGITNQVEEIKKQITKRIEGYEGKSLAEIPIHFREMFIVDSNGKARFNWGDRSKNIVAGFTSSVARSRVAKLADGYIFDDMKDFVDKYTIEQMLDGLHTGVFGSEFRLDPNKVRSIIAGRSYELGGDPYMVKQIFAVKATLGALANKIDVSRAATNAQTQHSVNKLVELYGGAGESQTLAHVLREANQRFATINPKAKPLVEAAELEKILQRGNAGEIASQINRSFSETQASRNTIAALVQEATRSNFRNTAL